MQKYFDFFLFSLNPFHFPLSIALVKTSNTTLNQSRENRYYCFLPDHSENPSFSLCFKTRATGLSYITFIMMKCFLCPPSLQSFDHDRMLDLIKDCFHVYYNDYVASVIETIYVMKYIY